MAERVVGAVFDRRVEIALGQIIRPFPRGDELLPDEFGGYQSPNFAVHGVGVARVALIPIAGFHGEIEVLRMARENNRTIWQAVEPRDFEIIAELDFAEASVNRNITCVLDGGGERLKARNSHPYPRETTALFESWKRNRRKVQPSVELKPGLLKAIRLSFSY